MPRIGIQHQVYIRQGMEDVVYAVAGLLVVVLAGGVNVGLVLPILPKFGLGKNS